jgi:PAS domain S-box-containing protein
MLFDRQGRCLTSNRPGLTMMKVSDREIIGREFRDIWPEDVRPTVDASVSEVLKGKRCAFDAYRMNGPEKGWWSVSLNPLIDNSGSVYRFIAIGTDITERMQAEEALRQSEQRYRSVVNNIAIGIAVISPEMEILSLNSQMKKWFPETNVLDRPICFRTFNTPPRETICPYCTTYLTLKDGRVHETITDTPAGDKIINYRVLSSPIRDKDGRVIAAIEMVEDVTELKHAAQALKESESKFRDLSEKSLVGIYLIQDDIFKYVNPMLAEIFGYRVDELIGKKGPADLVWPEDWPKVKENIKARLAEEVKAVHYEFRGQKRDSDVRFIEAYGSRTTYNERPAVIGTLMDITQRKKDTAERERLIGELKEAALTIKTLQGILPICSCCKKIRDDKGYWSQIEKYITEHSSAEFSHSICPDCAKKIYPDHYDKMFGADKKRPT